MSRTVLKLKEENQYDFLLVGIICQHKDYRLCRELNRCLEVDLKKQDDYEVFNHKRMEAQCFSFYQFITDDEDQFRLLSNKGSRGVLVPEQHQMDYLLLIRSKMMRIDTMEIISQLKKIPFVLGVYLLDPLKLKSKENLVF